VESTFNAIIHYTENCHSKASGSDEPPKRCWRLQIAAAVAPAGLSAVRVDTSAWFSAREKDRPLFKALDVGGLSPRIFVPEAQRRNRKSEHVCKPYFRLDRHDSSRVAIQMQACLSIVRDGDISSTCRSNFETSPARIAKFGAARRKPLPASVARRDRLSGLTRPGGRPEVVDAGDCGANSGSNLLYSHAARSLCAGSTNFDHVILMAYQPRP
jgi:hypothetical protein